MCYDNEPALKKKYDNAIVQCIRPISQEQCSQCTIRMRWYVLRTCRPADSCNTFINKASHNLDRQGSFVVPSHTFSKAKDPVKT